MTEIVPCVANARRVLGLVGLAAVVAAAALLFWPMNARGVTGTAARPHYRDFGWYSYSPLPPNPSSADFRRAGIVLPQDIVKKRRALALAIATIGATAFARGRWSVPAP